MDGNVPKKNTLSPLSFGALVIAILGIAIGFLASSFHYLSNDQFPWLTASASVIVLLVAGFVYRMERKSRIGSC